MQNGIRMNSHEQRSSVPKYGYFKDLGNRLIEVVLRKTDIHFEFHMSFL